MEALPLICRYIKNKNIEDLCVVSPDHGGDVYKRQTEDFKKYEATMLHDIQDKFQYYQYQRNGIVSQIRLSHIYYVESLRHQIIIHSINGTMVERKNLKAFLDTIQSSQFIQIHKSFIVNKQWIQNIFSDHVLLKNAETLQIGRAYKSHIQLL